MSTPEKCKSGTTVTSNANDQVLCATAGNSNAFLANGGTGNVLLIGNAGNDQLVGTTAAGGETWIISGTGRRERDQRQGRQRLHPEARRRP